MSQIAPQTLLDALNLFINKKETIVGKRSIANLRTALRKYVLPNLPGYSFSSNNLEGIGFEYHLSLIPLEAFVQISPLEMLVKSCQIACEAGQLKPTVERTTYRPALNKFLQWLEQENWYSEVFEPNQGKYSPRMRSGTHLAQANRESRNPKTRTQVYGLKQTEVPPKVSRQLEELHQFCTGEYVPHRQDKKMRKSTFKNQRKIALLFLGWLRNIEGWQEELLDLRLLENTELLNQFISWSINERGNTCGWACGFCNLALNIAKWQHCHESKKPKYRDIDSVEEIRMINNKLRERYKEQKKANRKVKRLQKEMTLEQCIEVLKYLRKCCAPMNFSKKKRPDLSIIRTWMRYLIIAILTYCPVRQREIRELELGRTLLRTPDGYRVVLQPEDNKTGDERDFMLSDILPPEVVADLDEWFDYWRPKMESAIHDLDSWLSLVTRPNYKNVEELTDYIAGLRQEIEQAEGEGDSEKAAMFLKKLKSAQNNYESFSKARADFQENLVFPSLGNSSLESYGKQLNSSSLYSIVTRAVYSATVALKAEGNLLFENVDPRKTHPHYYRNIAITHERRYGDPTKRKAFHKVLGNSEKMGDEVYNEMHPSEKTIDAKGWWQSETLQGKPAIIAHIKTLMSKLTSEERRQLFLELL